MASISPEQFGHTASYPEISKSDLSTPDARRSRAVSSSEFQSLAAEGHRRYDALRNKPGGTAGLSNHFDSIVDSTYAAAKEPWGGATINPRTGNSLSNLKGGAMAMTVREPGTKRVSIPSTASHDEYKAAVSQAIQEHSASLSRAKHHLGIFHDHDRGTIDIDPVLVTRKPSDVETIGAYTRATGGAYHFESGDGYWPPHVAK